jgi:hypothetical protein
MDFSLLQNHPHWLQGRPSLLFKGSRGSFAWVKRPGREVNHLPPPSTEVKNVWSYTPTHPTCLDDVDRNYTAFLGALAELRKVTISFVISVRPHGQTRFPLDGSPRNLIFANLSKICRENSSFMKIREE